MIFLMTQAGADLPSLGFVNLRDNFVRLVVFPGVGNRSTESRHRG